MTAPVASARQSPDGRKLKNGYRSVVCCTLDPDLEIWERECQLPGMEGPDALDLTTMHNNVARTKAPGALLDYGEASFKGPFDPIVYESLKAIALLETTFTWHLPDGSTLAFYGFVKSGVPDSIKENTVPEMLVTIVVTNVDPATGDEELPVLTSAEGT